MACQRTDQRERLNSHLPARVPAAPFEQWLKEMQALHGQAWLKASALLWGVPYDSLYRISVSRNNTVLLAVVDNIMTQEHLHISALYPEFSDA